jgi:hypothetical protein
MTAWNWDLPVNTTGKMKIFENITEYTGRCSDYTANREEKDTNRFRQIENRSLS